MGKPKIGFEGGKHEQSPVASWNFHQCLLSQALPLSSCSFIHFGGPYGKVFNVRGWDAKCHIDRSDLEGCQFQL